MYYWLIVLSVLLFAACFKLNDLYRRGAGESFAVSIRFAFVSSLATLPVLLAICSFDITPTPFTILMASFASINGVLFSFCTFRALGKINLSLYSLFSMLGGMALPFAQGLIFYNEPLTVAKSVCFILTAAALLLTLKPGGGKGGFIYYLGIFTLNGMSGVLTKIFVSSPYPKASAQVYSAWGSIMTVVITGVILLVMLLRGVKLSGERAGTVLIAASTGIINKVANLILTISLVYVDTSVQYPMVTGGVMIASTLICFFDRSGKKPDWREIASVIVAFLGTLALFVIKV